MVKLDGNTSALTNLSNTDSQQFLFEESNFNNNINNQQLPTIDPHNNNSIITTTSSSTFDQSNNDQIAALLGLNCSGIASTAASATLSASAPLPSASTSYLTTLGNSGGEGVEGTNATSANCEGLSMLFVSFCFLLQL